MNVAVLKRGVRLARDGSKLECAVENVLSKELDRIQGELTYASGSVGANFAIATTLPSEESST